MSIQAYIINEIELRSPEEKISDLQKRFDQITFSHLPVGKDGVYLGSISENDARTFDVQKTIEDYQFSLESFFVRDTDNWLDVLEAFSTNETNLLPVLNEDNQYLGFVELYEIVCLFTETPFLNHSGGIIILEKGSRDYSFSEITQIVESNGEHVLGMFLSKQENDITQITLKIGQNSLNSILQSFRRYGYNVVSHHQEDTFNDNLRDRSEYLDKYLNI